MKKGGLVIVFIALLLFNVRFVYAKEIDIPTSEHVADSIVFFSVKQIDEYIKQMPEPTSFFPNGTFSFKLDDNYVITFSPAFINGKVFRSVEFAAPENFVHIIIVDGPINSPPGDIKPELMEQASIILNDHLLSSGMIITRVNKQELRINLSSGQEFGNFIDMMYNSITVNSSYNEPEATGPITIPKDNTANLSQENKESEKNKLGIDYTSQISAKINFRKEEEIILSRNDITNESQLGAGRQKVISSNSMEVKNSKLYLETSSGEKEIKVSPEEASIERGISNIEEMLLKQENEKTIYSVIGEKRGKLLLIIPVKVRVQQKISAETGEIISTKKPWWSSMVSGI